MIKTILQCGVLLASCITAWAQPGPTVIPLWPNGAPGYENRKNEPEEARDYWVKNIHNPSITVYLPSREKANGAAVIICPGGGHRELVYNAEGKDPAIFFNSLGVTAIVLKYRLAREVNSPYSIEKEVKQDVFRAMRLVRHHASEWKLDTGKIGIMGFSAGGEVAALVAYTAGTSNPGAADPVDRLNARPNFQVLIYPGPGQIPDHIPAYAPPAFLLVANDDSCCSVSVMKLLKAYRDAGVSVEAHIYAKGNHAFNMGYRSQLQSIKSWPQRLAEWLIDSGIIH